jgi:hypothetical protein
MGGEILEAAQVTGLTDIFVKMAQHYTELWHEGRMPEGEARVVFISRVLELYMPESDRQLTGIFSVAEWVRERDIVAGHLVEACDLLARSQEQRWRN